MRNNISYEALNQPQAFHAQAMAEHTPDSLGAKGSYELYDSQRRSAPAYIGEGSMHDSPAFGAPGSPGSFQDYKQMATRLHKELEERKKKEVEMNHYINSLKQQVQTSHSIINTTSLVDNSFMNPDGPSSNENLDESVKDAHLKHLQRQVTILQASLYKAQEWSAKVTQERNDAEEKLNFMASEFSLLKRENETLAAELTTAKNTFQKQLWQAQGQNQGQQGQRVIQLQELVNKQKAEITTLKESLQRLHEESKEPKSSRNLSLGNVACSQELEYLHKVVDTLKSTVVEQRNFLLKMRTPGSSQGSNQGLPSAATSSNGQVMNGGLNLSHLAGAYRGSASPTLGSAGKDNGSLKNGQSESLTYGHRSQGAVPKTNFQRKSSFDEAAAVANSQEGAVGGGNYFQEIEQANPTACHIGRDEGYVRLRQESDMEKLQGNIFQFPSAANADSAGQRSRPGVGHSGSRMLNGGVPPRPAKEPQHATLQRKKSQSEVVASRTDLEPLNLQPQSKSEAITRNSDRHLQANNSLSQWILKSGGQEIDNGATLPVGSGSLRSSPQRSVPVNTQLPVKSRTPGIAHEAGILPDMSRWGSGNTGNLTPNLLDADFTGRMEHLKMESATSQQQQQIYHPPSNYQDNTVRMLNQELMGGGRMTAAAPPPPSPQFQNAHELYMNLSPNNTGTSSVDPDPIPPNLNSDRQCPVCNRDYSQVSVEDFQAHVFECFDDEHAPETMKPEESLDRTCPMCHTKFGSTTKQEEFEAHVHSHFGEAPGENFEILQP